MLFRFVVRAALWSFFAIVIAVAGTVFTIDLRVADWLFGTDDRLYSALQRLIGELRDVYGVKRDRIDTALKVVGLTATITLGVLGMLRAFLLGYASLPTRLAQFADNIRSMHFDDRQALLAPFAYLRGDHAPPAAPGIWTRILRSLGLNAHSRAVDRVRGTTERLDGDLLVLNAALRLRKAERITGHLLEGLRTADEARRLPDGSMAQQDRNRAALAEFERAVALDNSDLDALELTAMQGRLVNANAVAARLERMETVAQEQHRPVRRARALRLHAKFIADTDARRTALRGVRTKLEAALAILTEQQATTERPVEPDGDLERALVNEELARLHMRRGTFTLVMPYLNDADALYGRLPLSEGPAGHRRVEVLRSELARAQLGGDDPDDAGDCSVVISQAPRPTRHVAEDVGR